MGHQPDDRSGAETGRMRAGDRDGLPETEELKESQREREQAEREQATAATDEHETRQHERRAEKARYLREKLDERAASEREER
jgi:hypothetical protein